LDTYPIDTCSLEKFYPHVNGKQLSEQYKEHLSDYKEWEDKPHASEWLVFQENIGEYLSIDETAISDGELYTIVTNKAAKGRKGAIVAIVESTESNKVIEVLEKIPEDKRKQVKEVTLDLSNSMRKIVRRCFPKANRVIDRFHVQKLAYDALQEIRIAHRWDAINEETEEIEQSKLSNRKYEPIVLQNGDSKKQLLARSRYLLFKSSDKWTEKQKKRAKELSVNKSYVIFG